MDSTGLFSVDSDELVSSLNLLLDTLEIPIELESPLDLTPTLLLLILESALKSRLPLPDKLREARSPQAKVEAVKIFLGVLGNDVLREDLSNIDPRRIAQGEWEETVYVAKLLLLVAKRVGLLGVEEIVDLDPNQSYSKVQADLSILSDASTVKLQPEEVSIFSSPLASGHPLHAPLSSPKRSNPREARRSIHSETPRSIRSNRSIQSQVPERQSTPPLDMKPLSPSNIRSPKTYLDASASSICTCSLDTDNTTMHCYCDVHTAHSEVLWL